MLPVSVTAMPVGSTLNATDISTTFDSSAAESGVVSGVLDTVVLPEDAAWKYWNSFPLGRITFVASVVVL